MTEHEHTVAGQPDVGFKPIDARGDGGLETLQRVFRPERPRPAVPDYGKRASYSSQSQPGVGPKTPRTT